MKNGKKNGVASTVERKRRKPKAVSALKPDQTRNTADPGDETQRNFRYQHSYGVILLIAAKIGKKPYVAIWCEHHEDLLAERSDGRFDGYQIKTSRPEAGAWNMLEPDLIKSVGRFADLIQQFGDSIANVFFVSNTSFLEVTDTSTDQKRRAKCPRAFLEHVRTCGSPEEVALPYSAVFQSIVAACACDPTVLLAVFRRMDVIVGPSRDSFDAVLSHEHLGAVPECKGLCVGELDALRNELVAKVYRASSLQVTAPERHTLPLFATGDGDPVLAAKRLSVQDIELKPPSSGGQVHFKFIGMPAITLQSARRVDVLRQKLDRGGISTDDADDITDKGRAAEAHLIAETHKHPERSVNMIRQLEAMVLGECREAYLRTSQKGELFGVRMLIDVQNRLRKLATERPHMVANQEYECLLGMAGMLTEECRIWWSKRFPIQENV